MKSLIVVMVFFLIIQADELTDGDRYEIALRCISEIGIDRAVVEQAVAGIIPRNNIKYKDFLACSYKKQGYQGENGEILIENVKTFLAKFYAVSDLRVLNACAGFSGPNHGENAFNAMECVIQHLKNMTVLRD